MKTLGMLVKAFNQIHHPHFVRTRSSMNFFLLWELGGCALSFPYGETHPGISGRCVTKGVFLSANPKTDFGS